MATLEQIKVRFMLVEGVVIRISTGKPVLEKHGLKGYQQIGMGGRGTVPERYHRVKFALLHGYLPEIVDHKDRDKLHNNWDNLRPATKQQNAWNVRSLGVRQKPSGRWQAYLRSKSLGTFDTKTEALEARLKACQEQRGEFYAG